MASLSVSRRPGAFARVGEYVPDFPNGFLRVFVSGDAPRIKLDLLLARSLTTEKTVTHMHSDHLLRS